MKDISNPDKPKSEPAGCQAEGKTRTTHVGEPGLAPTPKSQKTKKLEV